MKKLILFALLLLPVASYAQTRPVVKQEIVTPVVSFPEGCGGLFNKCEGWVFSYGTSPMDINHAVYNKRHGRDDWAVTVEAARALADAKFKGTIK